MIFRYFVRKNAPYENADFKFIVSGEEDDNKKPRSRENIA